MYRDGEIVPGTTCDTEGGHYSASRAGLCSCNASTQKASVLLHGSSSQFPPKPDTTQNEHFHARHRRALFWPCCLFICEDWFPVSPPKQSLPSPFLEMGRGEQKELLETYLWSQMAPEKKRVHYSTGGSPCLALPYQAISPPGPQEST